MAGHGHIEHNSENKRIALLIAVLALCLAIAETGAKSAQTDALSRNVEASNLWAFFQARTVRQTVVRTAAEELALQAPLGDARDAARAQQIQSWQATAQRWESEPSNGEGRRELAERAKVAEAARDKAMASYHLHEYGAAAFQVAIVVVSASVITGVGLLAMGGGVLGLIGVVLTILGFFAPQMIHF